MLHCVIFDRLTMASQTKMTRATCMLEITSFYGGRQHPSTNDDSWREEVVCCHVKMPIFQRQQDERAELNQCVIDEMRQFQLRYPDSMPRHNQVEPQLSRHTGSFKFTH